MSLSSKRILTELGEPAHRIQPAAITQVEHKVITGSRSDLAHSIPRENFVDSKLQDDMFSITASESKTLSTSEPEEKIQVRSFEALTEEVENKFTGEERENAVNFMIGENYYVAYLKYLAAKQSHLIIMHYDGSLPTSMTNMLAHLSKAGIDPMGHFLHLQTAPKTRVSKNTVVSIPLCYGKNLGRKTAQYFRKLFYSYPGVKQFQIYLTDIPAKFSCKNESLELQRWKDHIEGALKPLQADMIINVITNNDLRLNETYLTAQKAVDPLFHSTTNTIEKDVKYDAYTYLLAKCDPEALAAKKSEHDSSDESIDILPLKTLSVLSSAKIDPKYTQMMIESAERAIQLEVARNGGKQLTPKDKQRVMRDSIENSIMFFQALGEHIAPAAAAKPTQAMPKVSARFKI